MPLESARGLHVHASVAYTQGRRPLGVSDLEVWGRPLQEPPGARRQRGEAGVEAWLVHDGGLEHALDAAGH